MGVLGQKSHSDEVFARALNFYNSFGKRKTMKKTQVMPLHTTLLLEKAIFVIGDHISHPATHKNSANFVSNKLLATQGEEPSTHLRLPEAASNLRSSSLISIDFHNFAVLP